MPGKKRRRMKPRMLSATRFQTGSSDTSRDRAHRAMLPGLRISRFGRVYWERRKNRSDTRRSRT